MTDSVGARLRQAREQRHLTLQDASESTKLRIHYLQALENDDYSAIPSAAQARGFLRLYAEFLSLDLSGVAPAAPPVITAAPEAVAAPVAPPAASKSLWSSLRQRFSRGGNKDAGAVVPTSTPEQLSPPANAVSPQPSDRIVPAPASTEIKTKESRKPKPASGEDAASVKKKAGL